MSNLVRYDGLENAVTGMGQRSHDPSRHFYATRNFNTYLPQDFCDAYYENDGIIKKIVNTMPEVSTRQGWGTLGLGRDNKNDDVVDKLNQFLENLPVTGMMMDEIGVRTAFKEAQCGANKYGNYGAIIICDDGEPDLSKPINLTGLKSVDGLHLVERDQIRPVTTGAFLSTIESYQILQGGISSVLVNQFDRPYSSVNSSTVHKSRVLWFRGDRLQGESLRRRGGYDQSVIESVLDSYHRYEAGKLNLGRMLHNAGTLLYGMKGLFDLLDSSDGTACGEATIKERVRILTLGMSSYHTATFDPDREEMKFLERSNMSGVQSVIDGFLDDLVAQTPLTKPIITGETPAGVLGGTDEASRNLWNEAVRTFQDSRYSGNIRKFINVVFASKEFEAPKNWDWQWNPIYNPTATEQATLQQTWAGLAVQLSQVDPRVSQAIVLSNYSGATFNDNPTLPENVIEAIKRDLDKASEEQPEVDLDAEIEGGEDQGAIAPSEEGSTIPAEETRLESLHFDGDDRDRAKAEELLIAAVETVYRGNINQLSFESIGDDEVAIAFRDGNKYFRGQINEKSIKYSRHTPVRTDAVKDKCVKGLSCGASCIAANHECQNILDKNGADYFRSALKFIGRNKGKILTEGAVVAAGVIGSKVAGPVAGSIASATTRSAIAVGKKAYGRLKPVAGATKINSGNLMKAVKAAGGEFLSDLKSPKFQRKLEKDYLGDLAYGVVATAVSAIVPIPLVGDVAALKGSGKVAEIAGKVVQGIKKRRSP
jgi:phage-related protein (TIGR01555 family)